MGLRLIGLFMVALLFLGGATLLMLNYRFGLAECEELGPQTDIKNETKPDPSVRDTFHRWTKSGCPIRYDVIATIDGPEHCGWQSATFLNLAMPLGRVDSGQHLRFVRDAQAVYDAGMAERLALDTALPADAEDTGYRRRGMQLWMQPDQENFVFIVRNARSQTGERWPLDAAKRQCL